MSQALDLIGHIGPKVEEYFDFEGYGKTQYCHFDFELLYHFLF